MAMADYRTCDCCGTKAFYDAGLSYDDDVTEKPAFRIAGEDQGKFGLSLGYLGDWAVLCMDCAKTRKCVIVPIDTQEQS